MKYKKLVGPLPKEKRKRKEKKNDFLLSFLYLLPSFLSLQTFILTTPASAGRVERERVYCNEE